MPIRESLIGLQNHNKVTCFVNSPIQTLFYVPAFRNGILSLTTEETGEDTWRAIGDATIEKPILMSLQHLFARLALSDRSSLSTEDLTSSFGWDSAAIQESDVGEMTAFLIDRIREDFRSSTKNPSFIDDLMRVFIELRIKCLQCNETRTASKDHYLSIPVPCADQHDLLEVLSNSVKPAEATGSNKINCPQCGEKTDSVQSYTYVNAPDVLAFAINRFQIDFRRGRRVKLTSKLSFPLEFDFAPFTQSSQSSTSSPPTSSPQDNEEKKSEEMLYELSAVTIHSGSAKHGHFNAYIRPDSLFNDSDGGGQWYNFNDERIRPIAEETIETSFEGPSSAYMLLYRRKDVSDAQPITPLSLIPPSVRKAVEEDNARLQAELEAAELKKNEITLTVYTTQKLEIRDALLSLPEGTHTLSDLPSVECVVDRRKTVGEVIGQLSTGVKSCSELSTSSTGALDHLHQLSIESDMLLLSKSLAKDAVLRDSGLAASQSVLLWDGESLTNGVRFDSSLNEKLQLECQYYFAPLYEYKSAKTFVVSLCRGSKLSELTKQITQECDALPIDTLLVQIACDHKAVREIDTEAELDVRIRDLGIPEKGSIAVERRDAVEQKSTSDDEDGKVPSLAEQYMTELARNPNFYNRRGSFAGWFKNRGGRGAKHNASTPEVRQGVGGAVPGAGATKTPVVRRFGGFRGAYRNN